MTTTTQLKAGGLASLPTPPTGWPIGSYATYAEAQHAVDYLADAEFPVQDVTMVGVEPMAVERVTARLTWGRVLAGGAVSGAGFGLFVGLLLSVFSTGAWWATVLIGVAFGMTFAAVSYESPSA